MKKWLILLPLLLLLCACGKQPEPVVIAGDAEESEVAYADIENLPPAETSVGDDAVTCEALQKDGSVYGFEMRMRQTDAVDALLCEPENAYFGVLKTDREQLAVPMEDVRILPDVTTDEFVLTLLVPQGKTLRAGDCTVSFCITTFAGGAEKLLFCAEKTVTLP